MRRLSRARVLSLTWRGLPSLGLLALVVSLGACQPDPDPASTSTTSDDNPPVVATFPETPPDQTPKRLVDHLNNMEALVDPLVEVPEMMGCETMGLDLVAYFNLARPDFAAAASHTDRMDDALRTDLVAAYKQWGNTTGRCFHDANVRTVTMQLTSLMKPLALYPSSPSPDATP